MQKTTTLPRADLLERQLDQVKALDPEALERICGGQAPRAIAAACYGVIIAGCEF